MLEVAVSAALSCTALAMEILSAAAKRGEDLSGQENLPLRDKLLTAVDHALAAEKLLRGEYLARVTPPALPAPSMDHKSPPLVSLGQAGYAHGLDCNGKAFSALDVTA